MQASNKEISWLYLGLYKNYGPQSWWPANTSFEVMIGAILTQNTAWTNVEKAIANLKQAKALNSSAILKLSDEILASMIRPSGYFNVKTKRLKAFCQWYEKQGGSKNLDKLNTETLRHELLSVHGVGPETADDILLYAFKRPVFVIDTYTRRLFSRLDFITGNEKYDVLREMVEDALENNTQHMNEFHALIVKHAKDFCKSTPDCNQCPVLKRCHYNRREDV